MIGQNPNLRILNASWYLPNVPRDPKKEHFEARITQDTQFFDIDGVVQPESDLPHTLPTCDIFTEHMKKLRIAPSHDIVCYDNLGIFSAPRVAWMFRYFGALNVRVLNGGMKKWLIDGRPTASGDQIQPIEMPEDAYNYQVVDKAKCFMNINDIHRIAFYISKKTSDYQILDARGAGRFNGTVPEPRAGLRGGHITGSVNLPFDQLINQETGCMKEDKELAKIFLEKGIDTTLPIVNSCGSGVTASVNDLGLSIMGAEHSAIYDGSWSEYVNLCVYNFYCRVLSMNQTSQRTHGLIQVSKSDFTELSLKSQY